MLDRQRVFARFAWGVLVYNVLVILWGAFVRATGSGAGCGSHWPTCNGSVVPREPGLKTLIEFGHRASSGIAALAVVALVVAAWRVFPKGHRVRKTAAASAVFIAGEVAIGAGLVLLELVAHDASMKRGLSMCLHLVNTFLLLAALVLTAWWSAPERRASDATGARAVKVFFWLSAALLVLTGVTGGIAALGDTLFRVNSVLEGMAQEFSRTAHPFVRLRLFHPVVAVMSALVLVLYSAIVRATLPTARAKMLGRFLSMLVAMQVLAGLLNVQLLAPVWMQIVHLALADAVWIVLVCIGAEGYVFAAQRTGRPVAASSSATSESPASTAMLSG